MRVLVAGASGVIGRSLIPRLLADRHEVVGLARSDGGARRIQDLGAEAVVADALDADALGNSVALARPESVINQLTAIPPVLNPRRLRRNLAPTNRLRTEGTQNLISAARAIGVRRHLAQSVAFAYAPGGPGLRVEDDPLNFGAPAEFAPTVAAIAALEHATRAVGGVVLRYGHLYGPGTTYARDGATTEAVRQRRLPIVGHGRGLFSFVHVDDAADATLAALELGDGELLNIVDDDPAAASEWIPAMARAVGAQPPRRLPADLARLFAGSWAVEYMDRLTGASNARAKSILGWSPATASWREGFATELGGRR